ncbi:S8 family serine peptidase [Solirubrobacter sp. CPCC 204708]|uniref:S8 family serine peptidase n=1 Tax=Solirubrobacter deserti TaxID=2282478 RepID=A0ABT4RSN6_9ACTN|nr:S8 family peptidase [Solirubrobacter deserti]MBE2317567.1 S8 family serine peptidase [Solirubrobacter deserti]MDA0141261.1 S8 family serine peptidase [Solirubrobacter deserti]
MVVAFALATAPASAAPTDALQGEQWAVAPGTVFDLPGAWALAAGAGVTVAVVDSGTRLDHADLAPNAWTNFAEVPGNNVDDDANGYVDDVHGVDLTTKGAAQDLHDGYGHGTHVAGTIAAAANGRGVVGVAYRAKIMTVKVLDDQGGGTTGGVAEGIRYAAAMGARIINLSLEGNVDDPRMRTAIEAAAAANALIVCSAGNSGVNVDQQPVYPVAIPASNVVGVAATEPDQGRSLPDFSNYGRLTVPVAAPGVEVISTSKSGGYEFKSGTSMAAPHVAGVAALMASVAPHLPAAELRAQLLQHATRGSVPVSAGYVDALGAVLAASGTASYDRSQPPSLRVLSATRKGRTTQAQLAVLGAAGSVARIELRLDGRRVAQLRGGRTVLNVRLRNRAGRRLAVYALAADGRRLSRASARVRTLRSGKRHVGTGGGIGGAVWVG